MVRSLVSCPEIDTLLAQDAPVAIGVSGGKDSSAVALATVAYLDGIRHKGPRLLIHSDLGRVEWKDSLPTCQRLAARLGLELVVVERAAGDMLARWEGRWRNNVRRYVDLSCVKLILPWSTASMRFCTSELKTDIICRALVKRFPGQTIVSVTGIRRDESANRAKAPIAKRQPKLSRGGASGLDWHPIADWTAADVYGYLAEQDFALHEAYTRYGSSRVSCCFCILGSQRDLKAATTCPDNVELYRSMVQLELESTFAFQDAHWLADLAPHLLTEGWRTLVPSRKERARAREEAERRIPEHLLYTKGWPTCIPTRAEAELLGEIRLAVGTAVGLTQTFVHPDEIIERYKALMAEKDVRDARKLGVAAAEGSV